MSAWAVYIVRCADGTFYTGMATDVGRRIAQHNAADGSGAKYTRSRRPVTLVYEEMVATRAEAGRREYEIKQLTRAQKIALISRSA